MAASSPAAAGVPSTVVAPAAPARPKPPAPVPTAVGAALSHPSGEAKVDLKLSESKVQLTKESIRDLELFIADKMYQLSTVRCCRPRLVSCWRFSCSAAR